MAAGAPATAAEVAIILCMLHYVNDKGIQDLPQCGIDTVNPDAP
jgi:hypothetical protein